MFKIITPYFRQLLVLIFTTYSSYHRKHICSLRVLFGHTIISQNHLELEMYVLLESIDLALIDESLIDD